MFVLSNRFGTKEPYSNIRDTFDSLSCSVRYSYIKQGMSHNGGTQKLFCKIRKNTLYLRISQ